MSEKRFTVRRDEKGVILIPNSILKDGEIIDEEEIVELLNKQQDKISQLEEEKGYWKSKAMTLLMQVRRLTPRMSAKEVIEFSKELEE